MLQLSERLLRTDRRAVTAGGLRVLVVGLGKTGLSCVRFLRRCGHQVAVTDSREAPPELVALQAESDDVALFLGRFAPEAFASADRIVVSPGVPIQTPELCEAIRRGIPVTGDIDLFAEHVHAPVIAVTGSNGKSTVTLLAARMAEASGLSVRAGGNLGPPALDLLSGHEPDLFVLELSSFQLERTRALRARAAVVLNVSPDHLDRHASMRHYAAQKRRIYRGCALAVINLDDPRVAQMRQGGRPERGFTLGEPADATIYGVRSVAGACWLCRGEEALLPAAALQLIGRHNVANALAALALTDNLGVALAPRLRALASFSGLPHRMQWVAERDGVCWYNDSKATNVGACVAAIDGLAATHDASRAAGRIVLIAGGVGKGADFNPLCPAVARNVRAVVLIGQDAPTIEAVLNGVAPTERAADLVDAVGRAARLARRGDAVLLSPACASFDMFAHFEARGEAFMQAVRRQLA